MDVVAPFLEICNHLTWYLNPQTAGLLVATITVPSETISTLPIELLVAKGSADVTAEFHQQLREELRADICRWLPGRPAA